MKLTMTSTMTRMMTAATLAALATTSAFGQAAATPSVQDKVAAIKQSVADNQARLKQYTWVETTAISLKGEVKKTDQNNCMYGADGKVMKTPVAAAAPAKQPEQSGGGRRSGKVKEKVVDNKVDEMKDYMQKAAALIKQYVPPDPQKMQASLQAGKAAIDKTTGQVVFSDYVKPGDKMTLALDPAAKKLNTFDVATYMDKPGDTVTLKASFSNLDDGTSFMQESVLSVKAKDIVVKTTNAGYKKAAQ
jgi:hypothetical protein